MTGNATVSVLNTDWRTTRIIELETAVNEYAALKIAAEGRTIEVQQQLNAITEQLAASIAHTVELEDQLRQARAALLQADNR